jgi:hypothetical protein
MTYEEAFDWIGENMEMDPEESYIEFLARVRESFYSQKLIDTLIDGVTMSKLEFGKQVEYQLTLEQFFDELRPKDTK